MIKVEDDNEFVATLKDDPKKIFYNFTFDGESIFGNGTMVAFKVSSKIVDNVHKLAIKNVA